jgi:hypothetical protein
MVSFVKQFIVVLLVVCFASTAYGQSSEVGFGLGTFNYSGDLVRGYNFKYSKPAATVFYRSNLSKVVSFRVALTGGQIGASEEPIDAFADKRNASFNLFLLEASTVFEYHFMNWRDTKRFVRFTPYLFGGLGLFGISGVEDKTAEYSTVQAAIPFGGGVKYVYNPKWYFSLEAGVRKTFFDYLDNTNQLTKTIVYNLNPSDNEVFATMMGNFNDGSVPGKMQLGSGWWFLDQKDGMERQMNTLSNMGLLSRFVGMVTDSRSFMSYPRHEYFRRILCNLMGKDIENGELPENFDWIGKIVQDVCYGNAKSFFRL